MAVTGYVIPCLDLALNMVDHVISRCLFHLKNLQPCYSSVSLIIHGSQIKVPTLVILFMVDHGQICAIERIWLTMVWFTMVKP